VKESVEEKAARLLTEGRLQLVDVSGYPPVVTYAEAICTGDSGDYELTFAQEAWRCSCPSTYECSHIKAARLVTGTVEILDAV
jgi:hypothetical protein